MVLDLPEGSNLKGGYMFDRMYLDKRDIEKGALPLSQTVFAEWQHSKYGDRPKLTDRTRPLYDEYYKFVQDMVTRYGKTVDIKTFLNSSHFEQSRRDEFMGWYQKQQGTGTKEAESEGPEELEE